MGGSLKQKHAPCEVPCNLIPLLRERSETNMKSKSTAKASPSLLHYKPRCRGTPPCHWALQGRVRSAVSRTASAGAVTGKREPRLHRAWRQSASSPGCGGLPARRRRLLGQTSPRVGRSQRSGSWNRPPPPLPPPRLCRTADAPTVGPKTLHPRQSFQSPTQQGDKGAKAELLGAG